MRVLIIVVLSSFFLSSVLAGCQQTSSTVDKYGTVTSVDKGQKQVEVDISEWGRDVGELSGQNDMGMGIVVKVTENVIIRYENEENATIDNIYEGQKVKILEGESGDIEELILLENEDSKNN